MRPPKNYFRCMEQRFNYWAQNRPFMLATIVLLTVVLPGFLAIGHSIQQSRHAADTAREAAVTAKAQADRNQVVVSCLTSWVADLTDALQDRDVVNNTARAAQRETWREIHRWLTDETPDPNRVEMIRAIDRFLIILRRLDRTTAINPYPEIDRCLTPSEIRAAMLLVSAHPVAQCFGRPVTIRGSSQKDVIHGTDGADVIRGFRGDDLIHAGAGNDLICGGRGQDTLNGGQDRDSARGQRGSDFCIQVEKPRSC